MSVVTLGDISQLSVAERIQLAQDIWDSVWTNPESLTLTDAERQELDLRLENYHQDPDSSVPWSEVKRRVRSATE